MCCCKQVTCRSAAVRRPSTWTCSRSHPHVADPDCSARPQDLQRRREFHHVQRKLTCMYNSASKYIFTTPTLPAVPVIFLSHNQYRFMEMANRALIRLLEPSPLSARTGPANQHARHPAVASTSRQPPPETSPRRVAAVSTRRTQE